MQWTPPYSEVVSKTRPGYIVKTKMAAASEFPTELATRPLGLIALMGLDINQKTLHKAIWESFSVNRHPERVPLSFRLLPIDHEFPKAKSMVRITYKFLLNMQASWQGEILRVNLLQIYV